VQRSEIYSLVRELISSFKSFANRQYVKWFNVTAVMHHGIQRSGTNYLNELLVQKRYFVINRHDPMRGSRFHKHCRWQPEKSRVLMDVSYRNSFLCNTIEELNQFCGFKEKQKHVVLFKKPGAWLDSINRWAEKCGWQVANQVDFLNLALVEWDDYYFFWQKFATESPDKVMLLNYELLKSEPCRAMATVDEFIGAGSNIELVNGGVLNQVSHSSLRADEPLGDALRAVSNPVNELIGCHEFRFDWSGRS